MTDATAEGEVRLEIVLDEDESADDVIAMLANGGLVGTDEGESVYIDQDGLMGSSPADVIWELAQYHVEAAAFVFCRFCRTWIDAFDGEDPDRYLLEHVDERHG